MIIANDAPIIAAAFEILAQPNVERWCNGRKFCVTPENPEGITYWQLMAKIRKLHERLLTEDAVPIHHMEETHE